MIQLQGVSFAYPDSPTPALRDIDLLIPDGQWVLLAGPSGGGKSTLLHLLNGLIPHILGGKLQGSVSVDNLVPANIPFARVEPTSWDSSAESRDAIIHAAGA